MVKAPLDLSRAPLLAGSAAEGNHHIVQHILKCKEECSSDGTLSHLGRNTYRIRVSDNRSRALQINLPL